MMDYIGLVNENKRKSVNLMEVYRKVIIITTYHSMMLVKNINLDVLYCDEAHTLASESQFSKFRDNFNLIRSNRYFFFSATTRDCTDEITDRFLMNNIHIFGERIGIKFSTAVYEGYIVNPIIHIAVPTNYEEIKDKEITITDKVKFIRETFSEHRKSIKNKSFQPNKLGAKILIRCSSVEEMWNLYNLLVGTMSNVNICAGASAENNYDGKHHINNISLKKRDTYLKKLQGFKDGEDAIVFHYDILSEGINIPGFTGIMFLSGNLPTLIKILQNVGRTTRLHWIDRENLLKGIISTKDHSLWVKPSCSVIIPYWNEISKDTKNELEKTIKKLRDKYGFDPQIEVSIGDDTIPGSGFDMERLNQERNKIKKPIVDKINSTIEKLDLDEKNELELKKLKTFSKIERIKYMRE